MSLKQRVSGLAAEKHISIAELERTLNFANGSIGKWDKQSPSGERLQAVANYFDVSVDYLLGNDVSPNTIVVKNPRIKKLARKMDSQNDATLNALEAMLDQIDNAKGADDH